MAPAKKKKGTKKKKTTSAKKTSSKNKPAPVDDNTPMLDYDHHYTLQLACKNPNFPAPDFEYPVRTDTTVAQLAARVRARHGHAVADITIYSTDAAGDDARLTDHTTELRALLPPERVESWTIRYEYAGELPSCPLIRREPRDLRIEKRIAAEAAAAPAARSTASKVPPPAGSIQRAGDSASMRRHTVVSAASGAGSAAPSSTRQRSTTLSETSGKPEAFSARLGETR